ncbi:hypothetical protein NDU88_003834, partial [Pleurodeles waltl]
DRAGQDPTQQNPGQERRYLTGRQAQSLYTTNEEQEATANRGSVPAWRQDTPSRDLDTPSRDCR